MSAEPNIQPIKSHTDILIQEAYDRGYADKAMKVDQAIEMEHSPKDCTLPCHVHQDTTSIDEQIARTMGYWSDQFGDCYPEKTAKIQALISDQVAKARIEELEVLDDSLYDITTVTWGEPTEGSIKEWGENHADLYVPTRDMHKVLEDRIAQLRQAIKGDK